MQERRGEEEELLELLLQNNMLTHKKRFFFLRTTSTSGLGEHFAVWVVCVRACVCVTLTSDSGIAAATLSQDFTEQVLAATASVVAMVMVAPFHAAEP